MIARVWRGWTSVSNADTYETHFRHEVLPHLQKLAGFCGARLLRRALADEIEFVAITTFASLKDVRAFAGADYETAVVAPAAQRVLIRFEPRCAHYDIAVDAGLTLDPRETRAK